MHVEEHQDGFPLLPPLYRAKPFLPPFAHSRGMPPYILATPFLCDPTPILPLGPPLVHYHSKKCHVKGFFGAYMRSYESEKGSVR